ncbi:MAG: PDZ domain-containing protein [Clostridiales bacterium]|jgi:serine protease Do|nr:PDZ domain-containing protein [Clostridiales bacterium]
MFSEYNSDEKKYSSEQNQESGKDLSNDNYEQVQDVTEFHDVGKVYNLYEEKNIKVNRSKKKGGFLKTVAAVLAVVILGSAAGFGGSWLYSYYNNNDNLLTDANNSQSKDKNTNTDEESHPTLSDMQKDTVDSGSNNTPTYIGKNENGVYENLSDLIEDVSSSVVYVSNYASAKADETSLQGTGSGIVISKDGYIITNQHVVSGAQKVTATIDSGKETEKVYDAEIIGTDKDTDLAVLKIDGKDLVAASLGDSDTLRVGDSVVAIGNPSGLIGTATQGIISGLNRKSSDDSRTLPSIQTDAAVNYGNSGGALFDMKGTVIGVVNAKIVSEGYDNLGFAITINQAKPIIEDLLSKGYVSGRPVLGITFLQIYPEMAELRGLDAGLYVTEINADLPVAESGLKLGDTITQIDGKDVSSLSDVQSILDDKKPNDKVKVKVIRYDTLGDKQELELEITLGEKIN